MIAMPMPEPVKQKEPSKMAKELAQKIKDECFFLDEESGWFDDAKAAELIQEYTNLLRMVIDAQTMSSYPMTNGAPAPRLF
jgi:hypothetical protein